MEPRRVAIVKSAGRADAFAKAVEQMGFVPVLVSPFREERIDGQDASFERLLRRGPTPIPGRPAAGPPRWVAVTSPNAAWVLESVNPWPDDVRIAVVGQGTASAVLATGRRVDLVGDAGGKALARRMIESDLAPGDVVLFPCGDETRPELTAELGDADVHVVTIPVYRMVDDPVGERAATGEFAAVVVGSPRLGERALRLFPSPRPPAIALGRTTAAALVAYGWPPAAVAAEATPEAVVEALRIALG
ncbi:MAG: uroporphyrinogen-III synthase [Planctomycetes bacterium]|nr:uroporphyrinogen-III synthase [Planctomycetota bacterium]